MTGTSHEQITDMLYGLIQGLTPHGYGADGALLPENGIYLFFEMGENASYEGLMVDRIVRVGINTGRGNFAERVLKNHYSGARGKSSFQRHIGSALLNKEGATKEQITGWGSRPYARMPDVQQWVRSLIRANFTFSCFEVESVVERKTLETALIAQLAKHPLGQPSETWLGNYSVNEQIRRYGLWNSDDVDKQPLTTEQFSRLQELIKQRSNKVGHNKEGNNITNAFLPGDYL